MRARIGLGPHFASVAAQPIGDKRLKSSTKCSFSSGFRAAVEPAINNALDDPNGRSFGPPAPSCSGGQEVPTNSRASVYTSHA